MEKTSALLDFYIKPAMQIEKLHSKESSDFIYKIKSIHSLPRDAIIVKVDVWSLYLFTPYKAGPKALRWTLEKIDIQKISADDMISTDVKIAGFTLKICF